MPVIENRWAVINPPPLHRIPVLIGGGGEKKTLRIVAQHADIWHSFSDVELMRHKLGVLRAHGDAVGRDVSEIEVSTEIRRRTESDADALVELGASLFTLGITAPEFDFDAVKRWLAWRDSRNAG
jgi:alkanesulfonate monooxygenase SsuD/methylene tetrahydromethanopterin reductase-like flavin-dependent oxidoreductase (luciferase family)